jgi:RNA polymerase sigma factor (sigma-70 family)
MEQDPEMTTLHSVESTRSALAKPYGDDEQLVKGCLEGNEASWSALLLKYKNLIYSIPIKYGFSREEASDVFQAVCLDLLHGLSDLRDPRALAGWLIRVTHNKCLHQIKQNRRFVASETDVLELTVAVTEIPENKLRELQREQILRTAIRSLNDRCQQLVEILFFESPPRPYAEIAKSLGLATGSIGFIRARCLHKLGQKLQELGFG